jgi:hypothetical protein
LGSQKGADTGEGGWSCWTFLHSTVTDFGTDCLRTLHLTKGNMHHAIKLVKLKKLVKAHGVTDHDLLSTLQIEDWDVAKAASYIMKRLQ